MTSPLPQTTDLLEDGSEKKSYGLNRGKKIYKGFNEERKVKNRKEKEQKRLAYTAFSKDFDKENNEFPAKHLDQIICGDAIKYLGQLPNNSTDLVITSPFHSLKLNNSSSDNIESLQERFTYFCEVLTECIRVLKYGGRIFINAEPSYANHSPTHHLISKFLFDQGLIWKAEIIWNKGQQKSNSKNNDEVTLNPELEYSWGFLEVFCKGNLKKEGLSKDIDIKDREFITWVNASWNIDQEEGMVSNGMPEQLIERILKLFSYRRDVILDPFNGDGVSTYVASKLKRHYLGIDSSKAKCKLANERLLIKKSA